MSVILCFFRCQLYSCFCNYAKIILVSLFFLDFSYNLCLLQYFLNQFSVLCQCCLASYDIMLLIHWKKCSTIHWTIHFLFQTHVMKTYKFCGCLWHSFTSSFKKTLILPLGILQSYVAASLLYFQCNPDLSFFVEYNHYFCSLNFFLWNFRWRWSKSRYIYCRSLFVHWTQFKNTVRTDCVILDKFSWLQFCLGCSHNSYMLDLVKMLAQVIDNSLWQQGLQASDSEYHVRDYIE